jgi:hypothetical protein
VIFIHFNLLIAIALILGFTKYSFLPGIFVGLDFVSDREWSGFRSNCETDRGPCRKPAPPYGGKDDGDTMESITLEPSICERHGN